MCIRDSQNGPHRQKTSVIDLDPLLDAPDIVLVKGVKIQPAQRYRLPVQKRQHEMRDEISLAERRGLFRIFFRQRGQRAKERFPV